MALKKEGALDKEQGRMVAFMRVHAFASDREGQHKRLVMVMIILMDLQ